MIGFNKYLFGVGVEYLFYFIYALETFVHALDIFLCYGSSALLDIVRITTQFVFCSSIIFDKGNFSSLTLTLLWSAGDPGSFRQRVSKSSLQTWRQSILLLKNHQKVFVEIDHTDHNIQLFDAAKDRQQKSSGCQPDHTTCFIFLHRHLTKLIFLRYLLTLFWYVDESGSFRRCVSESSFQTWRQSILLSKNHMLLRRRSVGGCAYWA
jgi:hypothetical protein